MYVYYGNPLAQAGTTTEYDFNLLQGLVGYWPMNDAGIDAEGETVIDASVNANTGTLYGDDGTGDNGTGMDCTATGNYGTACDFDGVDDYVTMGDLASFDFTTGAMAVSVWFKTPSRDITENERMVTHGTTGSNYGFDLGFIATDDVIFFGDSAGFRKTTNTFDDGNWHYVVAQHDGTNTLSGLSIYVDGVREDDGEAGTFNGFSANSEPLTIGALFDDGGRKQEYLGQIDDVRIYNRALSAAEITQLYYSNTSIQTAVSGTSNPSPSFAAEEIGPGPVLHLRFDEASGTVAKDSTSSGFNGTHNNTPTIQTEDMCVAGKCLWFDGTNNENVSKADEALLDFVAADNFTIQAWVKRNGASSANNFILTKAQSGYTGYKLYQDASGDYCFDVSDGSNTDTACTSAVDFDDDKWHLVQGVKTGTTDITLYVDGNQRAQDASIAATGTLANAGTFYIGVDLDGTSNEWLGFIDEVKVYPYARSAAQIATDYNSRGSSKGSSAVIASGAKQSLSNGLVGYWKMDEASATTTTTDSSGNGNTGSINLWGGGNTATSSARVGGKFGGGIDFDGGDDYVDVGDDNSLDLINDLTMGFWVKPSSVQSSSANILRKDAGLVDSNRNGFGIEMNGVANSNEYIAGWKHDSTNECWTNIFSLTSDVWQHVVVTKDDTVLTAYVNGVSTGSCTGGDSTIGTNTVSLQIGGWTVYSSRYFNGQIDEVRIYNRALSGAEVVDLYNFAPGPVAQYKLEEGSGTSANDSSGNGRTGTINGNPVWAPGKYGKGLKMDGTGDNVQVSDFEDE
jgi:hypothetical protein